MGTFPPVLLLDLELLDFNCYVFLQSDLNFFKHQLNKMHHPVYHVDYTILTLTLSIGIAIAPTVPTVAQLLILHQLPKLAFIQDVS